MERTRLNNLLKQNVLIIIFNRRTPPVGALRQMLCTKSDKVLSSLQGRINLNFRNPKHGKPAFDESKANVCVVWDILKQDYRLVPCESVSIIREISPDKWWEFYNNNIRPMSQTDKLEFMYG